MGIQELFESYDKRKRKSHFKNLLAVAYADGNLENVEFDYIMLLAQKCYTTEDEVRRVIDHPQEIDFVPPKTARERFDQVYDLVTVMLVDGEIHPKEMKLCKTFAIKLGFRPQIVDDLVEGIIQNVIKGIASDIAMKKLEKQII